MPVKAVAASRRRGACQTLDVTGRCGPGANARQTARGHDHVDVGTANPSGHVDVVVGPRAAVVTGSSLRAPLPDPWRSTGRRGDGPGLS
jgi:hypothetical protein